MESPSLTVTEKAVSSGMRILSKLIQLSGDYLFLNCPALPFEPQQCLSNGVAFFDSYRESDIVRYGCLIELIKLSGDELLLNCRSSTSSISAACPNRITLDHRNCRREGDSFWYVYVTLFRPSMFWYMMVGNFLRVGCVIGDCGVAVGVGGEV